MEPHRQWGTQAGSSLQPSMFMDGLEGIRTVGIAGVCCLCQHRIILQQGRGSCHGQALLGHAV